jgi:hypothetical protein
VSRSLTHSTWPRSSNCALGKPKQDNEKLPAGSSPCGALVASIMNRHSVSPMPNEPAPRTAQAEGGLPESKPCYRAGPARSLDCDQVIQADTAGDECHRAPDHGCVRGMTTERMRAPLWRFSAHATRAPSMDRPVGGAAAIAITFVFRLFASNVRTNLPLLKTT